MLKSLIRRTGHVAIGTALGQLAVLAVTPILTRRYSPATFGGLALLMSVQSVIVVGGCLRYDLAIPGAEEVEAADLQALCLIVGAFLTLAVVVAGSMIGLAGWGGAAAHLLSPPWLMATLLFSVIASQATGSMLIRRGDFKALGFLRASQGVSFALMAVIPLLGLSWGYALSFVPGCLFLWMQREALRNISLDGVKFALRRYAQFPFLSFPGALLDVTAYSTSIWVITRYYSLANVGQYSQVQRLIGGPMLLLSISLSQVILKHATDEHHAGRSLRLMVRHFALIMGGLTVAAMLVLLVMGSWMLRKILGPQWSVDTYFICLTAGTVFIRAIVSPLSAILIATQHFRAALLWQGLYFLSTVTVLPWIARYHGFNGYIAGYAIHEGVLYLIYFLVIYHCAGE